MQFLLKCSEIGKESHVTRCLAGSNATFVYILRTGTKQSARS